MERDQIEKMTREYQLLQEQLQALALQKEQFSEQKEEYKEALEEIEKAKGKIYIALGGVIVDVDKETALKNVKEKHESSEMRLSIVSKQYEDLAKKEQTLRTEITTALKDFKQQPG